MLVQLLLGQTFGLHIVLTISVTEVETEHKYFFAISSVAVPKGNLGETTGSHYRGSGSQDDVNWEAEWWA